MSYPHGRAQVDANNPRAFAVCDRCGFLYNHSDLRWQYDYRGRNLANLRFLVCDTCYDEPQPQLKPRILPPDPMPVLNARPERYAEYETNKRVTSEQQPVVSPTENSAWFWTGLPVPVGEVRITQSGNTRVTQQTGQPSGGINMLPGTILNVPDDEIVGLPYNTEAIPETGWMPGVNYVIWNNGNTYALRWQNDVGGVLTWVSE